MAAVKTWKSISKEVTNNLLMSVNNRLDTVIANKELATEQVGYTVSIFEYQEIKPEVFNHFIFIF